ncbi:MAG: hypothetical protein AAGD01_20660 [Acidobacteriota bacterium]
MSEKDLHFLSASGPGNGEDAAPGRNPSMGEPVSGDEAGSTDPASVLESPLPAEAVKARYLSVLPEPGRLWVRYIPERWPVHRGLWVNVAEATLGSSTRRGGAVKAVEDWAAPLDDVLYLPPVSKGNEALRDDAVAAHAEAGTPLLVQLAPGQELSSELASSPGVVVLYDPSDGLLRGNEAALLGSPRNAWVLMPLVSGMTSDGQLWRRALANFRDTGAGHVQGMALFLSAQHRRVLADYADDSGFHGLFHRQPPSEREFAQVAHRRGFAPFRSRPLPRNASPRLRSNRRLAGELAQVAELSLRLSRSGGGRGPALFRAARWIDASQHDVAALAREGHLELVEAMDEASRALLKEAVESGGTGLLERLVREYAGPVELDRTSV